MALVSRGTFFEKKSQLLFFLMEETQLFQNIISAETIPDSSKAH